MSAVETLIPAAFRLGRQTFISHHSGYHLLKPPATVEEQGLGYQTLQVADMAELPESHIVPSGRCWQATKVMKRPGNPYPDRISIGRATNCDIVLRFAVVSKLHAHLSLRADGRLTLIDHGSANGTWHDGRRLVPGEPAAIGPGDALSFGGVRCELIDGAGLYDLVSGNRSRH
ncbi:MAG: FHA domain-containing protein [Myxococcales bacterium]|nr:FHA domain-containing protein [Myxococcales bacterium]MCB9716616.1 FHA domain-containing protein [Myxococcales bacterium]